MSGILDEVRAFVSALKEQLPEVFVPPAPRPRPGKPAGGGADLFAERCARFAPGLGVAFGKVRAKEMSSLWGSCSPRGDLSFNRRLLEAPPEV
ncbi:MAG: M48 family metallopeptidase, partial [Elusimicrobia bacterium]|nr:M48 family metallopeptidase [Elusimicrobiota bacterium]